MKPAVTLFALLVLAGCASLPKTGFQPGDIIHARGICQTHELIADIARLMQDGKAQESDDLFVDSVDAGRCEYHPTGTPVELVWAFEPYTFENRELHLWSVKTDDGTGFLVIDDK